MQQALSVACALLIRYNPAKLNALSDYIRIAVLAVDAAKLRNSIQTCKNPDVFFHEVMIS